MVEFAIVLPVLILIILGILYFGRYEDYSNQETQMAEAGVRAASVNFNPPGTQTVQDYIRTQAQPELQAGSSDVTSPAAVYIYYPTGSSNVVGNSVRVCVAATVKFPFLANTSQVIAEAATMRIEVAATNWSTSDNPASMPSACPSS
jgi:Flp pilus assembly protein TadG